MYTPNYGKLSFSRKILVPVNLDPATKLLFSGREGSKLKFSSSSGHNEYTYTAGNLVSDGLNKGTPATTPQLRAMAEALPAHNVQLGNRFQLENVLDRVSLMNSGQDPDSIMHGVPHTIQQMVQQEGGNVIPVAQNMTLTSDKSTAENKMMGELKNFIFSEKEKGHSPNAYNASSLLTRTLQYEDEDGEIKSGKLPSTPENRKIINDYRKEIEWVRNVE